MTRVQSTEVVLLSGVVFELRRQNLNLVSLISFLSENVRTVGGLET